MTEIDGDGDGWLTEAVVSAIAATGHDEDTEQEEEEDSSTFEIERKRVVGFELFPELPPHRVPFVS